jgi:hypothetical protein
VLGVRVEDRRRDASASHRHRLLVLLDDETEAKFLIDDPPAWERAFAALGDSAGTGDSES